MAKSRGHEILFIDCQYRGLHCYYACPDNHTLCSYGQYAH